MSLPAATLRRGLLGGRLGRRRGAKLTPAQAATTLVAALAAAVMVTPAHISPLAAVGVLAAGLAGLLLARSPSWCLIALVGTTLFGYYRASVPVGPLDLRVTDAPLVLLVACAAYSRAKHGRAPRQEVGQSALALVLVALGLSLMVGIAGEGSEDAVALLVSFGRAVATFSLVWLVPYIARTPADRWLVLRATVLLGAAQLLYTIIDHVSSGASGRLRGVNGPNVEGLIAGAVMVAVVKLPLFRWRTRVAIGALAGLSLVSTRSIAAIAALLLVLGVLGLGASAARSARAEGLVRPIRLLAFVVGGVMLVSALRPHNLPNSETFQSSSTIYRIAIAYAGVQVFLEHPLLGVGWRRSSSEDVIGSQAVVESLRSTFSQSRPVLSRSGQADSVHNAYIQVLAEGGLVAIGLLIAAIAAGRRGARRIMARAGAEAPVARAAIAIVLLLLIWFNDNPIFGAQPETVLLSVMLGLLASIRTVNSADTLPGLGAASPGR